MPFSLHNFKEKLCILPLIPKLIGFTFDKVPNENGATTTAGSISAGFRPNENFGTLGTVVGDGVTFGKNPNEKGATTTAGVVVIDAGFKLLLASTVFL